jgi:hypothetical protein
MTFPGFPVPKCTSPLRQGLQPEGGPLTNPSGGELGRTLPRERKMRTLPFIDRCDHSAAFTAFWQRAYTVYCACAQGRGAGARARRH